MIIEALRDYFSNCPLLSEFSKVINVNYLEDTDMYSIEEVPTQPIIKRYLNGMCKCQYDFIFASKESYSADIMQNISNSSFYEDFANWIEEQNNIDNLPVLDNNCEATKLEITTNGYAFGEDENNLRYQIQLKLIYMKE